MLQESLRLSFFLGDEELSTIDYDFQILKLTDHFYNAYPRSCYPEILQKGKRAYNCIVFEMSSEYFLCIPYRTEITHRYAYHFRNSSRSIQHKSGLDYAKMVIVKNMKYLDSTQAIVDTDEYIETVTNMDKIKDEVLDFLEVYVKHVKGDVVLHASEYRRRYQYSPLQYFHLELGL